jgi:hypothetical protein
VTSKHRVLVALAFSWVAVDFWIVAGNVILRETILGPAARLLDRLPNEMNHSSFLVLWLVLLFGWMIPLGAGLKPLLRKRR